MLKLRGLLIGSIYANFGERKATSHWLNNNSEIDFAILFGSYAKGTHTHQSDIDLAIQLTSTDKLKPEQKLDYINQLGSLLLINVDLKEVRQPLLSQIMEYGKQLKGNQLQYAELAIKNVNTGQYFLPYIKRIMAE